MRRELLRATAKWRWTWLVPLNDGWVACKNYRCCAAAAVLALCWAAHRRRIGLPRAHKKDLRRFSRRRLLSSSTGCLFQKTKLLVVRVTEVVRSTWKVSVPSYACTMVSPVVASTNERTSP